MTTRSRKRSGSLHPWTAAAAIAVLAAAVATAPAADAHGAPYTVTAGSAPTGTTVQVTKTTVGTTPQVIFQDTTTNTTLQCSSAFLRGSVVTGSSNGTPLVTLDGASVVFNSCTGPFGLAFKITGYGTWYINVTDSTSGVSRGTVTNIRAHVQATSGPTCGFDVGANSGTFSSSGTATIAPGSIAGTYTNSTQQVTLPASNPGSLGIWNVNPAANAHTCVASSVLAQGDKASFSATFKLTANNSAYNPVAIN